MDKPAVIYADNAVLTYLAGIHGSPSGRGLAAMLESRRAKLCVSTILLLEIHKNENGNQVRQVMDTLARLELMQQIAWMAWPGLLWDRELLHYEGIHAIPAATRSFVVGPTNLTTLANTDRALERNENLATVVQDLLGHRFKSFNDLLDNLAGSFARDRAKHLARGEAYSFPNYVLQQLQERDPRLQALYPRLLNKNDTYY